jgi:hypothetical protein
MLHNYRHELSRLSWLFIGVLHPPPLKAMYLKNRSQGNYENILKKVKRGRLIILCLFNYKIGGGQSLIYSPTPILSGQWRNEQPRSQGFSLFVIGKSGKGPGTGRSSMYSDWSMTSTLLCKECNLELIYSNFGIN